jgi:hypothetical protein
MYNYLEVRLKNEEGRETYTPIILVSDVKSSSILFEII